MYAFSLSPENLQHLPKVKGIVAQSCPTLCDPMDCSLPGSSVHGFPQARILEWVAIPFSKGSSQPRDQISVSCIAGRILIIWATREAPQSSTKWIIPLPAAQSWPSGAMCLLVSDLTFTYSSLFCKDVSNKVKESHLLRVFSPLSYRAKRAVVHSTVTRYV